MDATGLVTLAMGLSVPILLLVWLRWQQAKVAKAKQWPKTEAIIQSAAIELVAQTKFNTVCLRTFAFSYQVGGHYDSGRFALMPYTVEYDETNSMRLHEFGIAWIVINFRMADTVHPVPIGRCTAIVASGRSGNRFVRPPSARVDGVWNAGNTASPRSMKTEQAFLCRSHPSIDL